MNHGYYKVILEIFQDRIESSFMYQWYNLKTLLQLLEIVPWEHTISHQLHSHLYRIKNKKKYEFESMFENVLLWINILHLVVISHNGNNDDQMS